MSAKSNMAAAALLKGRAYEQMLVQFCQDAAAQLPDTCQDFITNAHMELDQLDTAIKTYINDHSSSLCGGCMWLQLTKSEDLGTPMLPGWHLPKDKDDSAWEGRMNNLMPTLQDRAIKELGRENVDFKCKSGEHTPMEEMKIEVKSTTAEKPAPVVPVKKAKITPPHMRSNAPLPTVTNTFTDPGAPITKTQQPTPPQSVSPEVAPADKSSSPTCAITTIEMPHDEDLSIVAADTTLTEDLKEVLTIHVLKAIDETMAAGEASIAALIQTRVEAQVAKGKIEWYAQWYHEQAKLESKRVKELADEKAEWEIETQKRIQAENIKLTAQWADDLRVIQASMVEERAQWQNDNLKVKEESAKEKIQWEEEMRASIKTQMLEDMKRALM